MIEAELAAAGFIINDSEIIISKDVRFGRNLNIVGDVTVAGDNTVTGDLHVGGEITGELVGKYYLPFTAFDTSDANSIYAVVPSDGAGIISAIRYVVVTAITNADATLTALVFGGSAISPANDLVVPFSGSAIGDVAVKLFASTLANTEVVAGDVLKLTSDGGGDAGVINGWFEITRT